jgi:hypothetical protein
MQQQPGPQFLRAVLQLLEEHSYHFSSTTERSIKIIRAKAPGAHHGGSADDDFAPSLQRVGGKVIYEFLLTPHVAHALSGAQVALSVCELLSELYRKLVECPAKAGGASMSAVCDAIVRADERIEDVFISPAAKHADALAKSALRQTLGRLDPLFGRLWGQSQPGPATDGLDTMERAAGGSAVTGAL